MTTPARRCQGVARRAVSLHYGEPCLYLADGDGVGLVAIPTKPLAMVDGEAAVIVDANALDFLIEAESIAMPAGIVAPAAGHQIKRWRGPTEETFEVCPPSANLPCFENVDANGALYRVHTKRITAA